MAVRIERIYDFKQRRKQRDEYAVLVDRLWPRGVAKDSVPIDEWLKDIAPSTELRKWFNHEAKKWQGFREKYRAELQASQDEIERLRRIAQEKSLVLLYSAKDEHHNQAAVLQEVISASSSRRAG